jgi:hypothetical protein
LPGRTVLPILGYERVNQTWFRLTEIPGNLAT